jgi:ELWxxDGT repeat protein
VNGNVFFGADDGNGLGLWKSGKATLVKDITPGRAGSYPYWLTNVDGTLFFSASDEPGPLDGQVEGMAVRRRVQRIELAVVVFRSAAWVCRPGSLQPGRANDGPGR